MGEGEAGSRDVHAVDMVALARAEQLKNARTISLSMTVLTVLGALLTAVVGVDWAMPYFLASTAAGMGVGYLCARRSALGLSVVILSASMLVEHVGAVAIHGKLSIIPFVAPAILLVVAATTRSRHLPLAFVACLGMLAAEGFVAARLPTDPATLGTAALLLALAFVVSLLHGRGVERALELASAQAEAREASAKQALDAEQRYRWIADSADDLISLIAASDGAVVYMSPSHARVLGLPLEVLSSGRFDEHIIVDNVSDVIDAFVQARAEGHARTEARLRTVRGLPRVFDVQMKRIEAHSGALISIISRDVSEKRALEGRLYAAERMDALGRLAGSVAHDFNNLLTVIQGSAELGRDRLPAGDPAREDWDLVLTATTTATDLARQLLTFSRRQVIIRAPTNVGDVVLAQRELLSRLVGPQVKLDVTIAQDLPVVMIPRVEVEQLTLNLATNARDAMPSGGQLKVLVRARQLGDREVEDLVAGEYVELSVEDSGQGIAPEILQSIFEPQFSTKGGLGTGLGLATCQAIALRAGGAISVSSEVGRGSQFRVYVPVGLESRSPPEAPSRDADLQHVLVVDDDQSVRALAPPSAAPPQSSSSRALPS